MKITGPLPWVPCFWIWVVVVFSAGNSLARSQEDVPSSTSDSSRNQVESLLKEGKPHEALTLLNAIAEKNPNTPGIDREMGKAYFQSRQFRQAIVHLKAALERDASDLESSQFLALSFYGMGNCRDAVPMLEKLGSQLPKDSPDAPYLLSICYVMTQRSDNARMSLAHLFGVAPESAMAYLSLGKLLVRQQMVEAAVPQIETALRLDPRLTMAHFLLGEIRLYQSQPQAAVVELQKELAINPTLWLVYWRLGDAYLRMEKYDEAEKVLKEAVWLNDASAGAVVLLGEIALKKNDPALASGFLERALTLDPQNADAHEFLGKAYKKLGRDADADKEMEISRKFRSQTHAGQQDTLQPAP